MENVFVSPVNTLRGVPFPTCQLPVLRTCAGVCQALQKISNIVATRGRRNTHTG